MCLRSELRRSSLAGLVVAFIALAVSSSAQAQAGDTPRTRFEGHLTLGWYGGLGLGFDADIPVVPEGVINGVEDDFAISPGLELYLLDLDDDHDSDFAVVPNAGFQWNFYFPGGWSVFPELGLGLRFGSHFHHHHDHGHHHHHDDEVGWFLFLALGGRYAFTPDNTFVLKLNFPMGLQLGVTF